MARVASNPEEANVGEASGAATVKDVEKRTSDLRARCGKTRNLRSAYELAEWLAATKENVEQN